MGRKPPLDEAADQVLHVASAVLVLAPVLLLRNMLGCALSGWMAGLVRETSLAGSKTSDLDLIVGRLTSADSALNQSFWAAGGLLVGYLLTPEQGV